VNHVVCVDKAATTAARKTTATIPPLQDPPGGRRDAAGLATDVQCLAVCRFMPMYDGKITLSASVFEYDEQIGREKSV
jgi:hypothetical protein